MARPKDGATIQPYLWPHCRKHKRYSGENSNKHLRGKLPTLICTYYLPLGIFCPAIPLPLNSSFSNFEGNGGKRQNLYRKFLEEGDNLNLSLEIYLLFIEETQDQSASGISDKPVHYFLHSFILID